MDSPNTHCNNTGMEKAVLSCVLDNSEPVYRVVEDIVCDSILEILQIIEEIDFFMLLVIVVRKRVTVEQTYSEVCGRIDATPFGIPEALDNYIQLDYSIEQEYIDGISLTHGSPGLKTST